MIKVNQVSKSFGAAKALDAATLSVPQGSVYGLVGPNGAGKSTLIRHIMGVYRPDEGEITLENQPVYDNPEAKRRMACIYDEIYYYLHATTRDIAKLYEGLYPRFDRQRFESLREAFPEVQDATPIRRLSKGMQKQSAFWLALSCRPDVLLLDEPVDGLDPVMRRQVWSLLAGDVAEYGTTVLVSSHNLRELEDVCDHVGVLHKGHVMLERSLSDLQGGVTKIQVLFGDEADEADGTPAGGEAHAAQVAQLFDVLNESAMGRMHTFIVRATAEEARERMAALEPRYLEVLPLTLEEIFVYELGGADYAVRNVLL